MQQPNIPITKILSNLNIEALNEMQLASIKANAEHNNIQLLSSTGTGKTLAFLIPILERLNPAIKTVQALVLAPSRELAIQIDEVFRKMSTGYKVSCCYGGHKREIEENNLLQSPALIIGTAGRIADHIRRENFPLTEIHTLVLDEFDKSLELGFVEEMKFIINSLPAVEKRILTSATPIALIPDFVQFTDPLKLDYTSMQVEKHIADELLLMKVHSPEKDKLETLFRLICQVGNKSIIIFCNHREAVERTSESLKDKGLVNVFYHGGMEQYERESAMCKFKNGTSNILVTTDLASRGLDIPDIKYIIHYHLPASQDVFTHRNGRTARMTSGGKSIMILSDDERLPNYIAEEVIQLELYDELELPEKPKWTTFYISAGKKDKVNKIDIVGFFSKIGNLKQEDIGLIEVKDFSSFVAIRKLKAGAVMELIKDVKIKNKKVKIEIAK